MQRIPSLYVTESEIHGRGVFTSSEIEKETLIEICPVIVIPEKDLELIHQTILHDYYFYWGEDEKDGAIVLGFGSMYNHSNSPNIYCIVNEESLSFEYYALRTIKAGEELLIDYSGDDDDKSNLWF